MAAHATDVGRPLATLRLAGDGLDPAMVNQILLDDDLRGWDVRSRPGVWMITTDGFASPDPQRHLERLASLLTAR